ncbi:unnamed protein product [Kuraishia capsulata CBS 1993]|uniref:Exocyst complex component Sec3 PIP2-binding N-terminal domain-containing protein n=1 Tax=Kuraishia capsulata CBS 1993 TaxID=1382522 RepID=W6MNY8_9ASCO|nr:uncharacterized protein KUCA_T00002751001 [Kuraishia capsulata CBS 1993]CDK26777.1 unnamed protein product [Kuraishia capsulata CBS 1993]
MHNAHKMVSGHGQRVLKEPRIQRLPQQHGSQDRRIQEHSRPVQAPVQNRSEPKPENHAMDLARQYDLDQKKIIKCCFSKTHNNHLVESYISHVRIIEDAKNTASRPPPDSPLKYKKSRLLIIAARPSGRLRLHKARENSDGTVQIGRTWDLDELSRIEIDPHLPTGFLAVMGKPYYWETNSPRERKVFCRTLLWHYMDYTGGKVPELINCSVESLGVDTKTVSRVSKVDMISTTLDDAPKNVADLPDVAPLRVSRNAEVPRIPEVTPIKQAPPQVYSNEEQFAASTAPLNFSAPEAIPDESMVKPLAIEKRSKPMSDREFHAHRRESSLKSLERLKGKKSSETSVDDSTPVFSRNAQGVVDTSSGPRLTHSRQSSIQKPSLPNIAQESEPVPKESIQENVNNRPDRPLSVSDVGFIAHQRTHDEIEDITGAEEATEDQSYSYNELDDFYDGYAEELSGEDGQEDDQVSIVQHLQVPVRQTLEPSKHLDDDDAASDLFSVGDEVDEITDFSFLPENDRSLNQKSNNGDMVEELFEEIGWSRSDTVQTIETKLRKLLRDSEYQSVKSLVDFSMDASSIESLISSGIHECNVLEPILSFFSIELSSFAEDIKHIEKQGRGLQIETTNKKLLWKEIRDLLEAVSISDHSLDILTTSTTSYSPQDVTSIKKVENVLIELDSALQTMRGASLKDDDDGKAMRALQERREKYEKTTEAFTQNVELQFKYLMHRSIGTLDVSSIPVAQIETAISRELAQLLIFAGITLFLRSASLSDYSGLMLSYQDQIREIYSVVAESLSAHVEKSKQVVSPPSISFKSDPKDIYGEKYRIRRNKSSHDRGGLNARDRLMERLGFSEETATETPNSSEVNFASVGEGVSELLDHFAAALINQQDMLVELFHLSSLHPTTLDEFAASRPVDQRVDQFLNPHRPKAISMEPDRNLASESMSSMSQMLSDYSQAVTKQVKSILKENPVEIPRTLAVIERMILTYNSTNQEFLIRKLTQLKSKLVTAWAVFVDKQIGIVSDSKLEGRNGSSYGVLRIVKVYPEFVRQVEASLSTLDFSIEDFQISEDVTKSYMELWRHLFSVLKGDKAMSNPTMGDLTKTTTNGSRGLVSNALTTISTSFHGDGSLEGDSLNHHIMLLLNFNWLLEEIKDVSKLGPIKTQLQELCHEETMAYADYVIRSGSAGRLLAFIEGVEGLTKADPSVGAVRNVDPSKRHAYAKDVLKKLLQTFDTKGVDKSVQGIVKQIHNELLGHAKYSDDMESPTSLSVIEDIEGALAEKVAGVIQNQLTSTLSRLNAIVDRYYPDVDVPVDRSEIAYAFKRAT